jgi:spore coat polysaccharide biosynthesis protein SpsF
MTSTRLPGKVLKKVAGTALLKYHATRVLQSGFPLYIATTTNATDDPIVAFCEAENLPYYRGAEAHVLSRYYECAQQHNLDIIVRVTSDCPLIDGAYIKKSVDYYLDQEQDWLYLSNSLSKTFPRGFDFEVFSFEMLEEAYRQANTPAEIEHVTPYFYLDKATKIEKQAFAYHQARSQYRITVDTQEDFKLIQQLIEEHDAHLKGIDEIVQLLDEHPALVAINAHIEQKKLEE